MVIKTSDPETENIIKNDPFAKLLGQFGKWQLLIVLSVSLVKLSSGWAQMAILFLTPNLSYRCVNLPNATDVILNDTCYEDCLQYEYDTSPFDNTIVSEWDLICERSWMASFTQTMLQLGILNGSAIFGFLSDKYGRKYTFLVAVIGVIITGLVIPFSPNYYVFTGLRIVLGIAVAGTMLISFVIIMESVGTRYREITGCLFHIPFIIGHMTVPLFAYYFRSWNTYTLALGIPPLLYFSCFFTVTETPRWLLSQGRVEEAIRITEKAAKMNKLPTTNIEDTLKQIFEETTKDVPKFKLNHMVLYRKPLLLKTVCCCIMWYIFGVTFYGFNQYLSQTSPDPFISVAFAGGMQIPAVILSIWLIKKFGRRLTISVFFILSGVFVIILYFAPNIFAVTVTLSTLGVTCASVVGTSIYIYTSELFPTVVRNTGMGMASTFTRMGSMVAPFVANTATNIPWLPTAIFGGAALVAGLVCLLLPETKGTKLPDTIEDIK